MARGLDDPGSKSEAVGNSPGDADPSERRQLGRHARDGPNHPVGQDETQAEHDQRADPPAPDHHHAWCTAKPVHEADARCVRMTMRSPVPMVVGVLDDCAVVNDVLVIVLMGDQEPPAGVHAESNERHPNDPRWNDDARGAEDATHNPNRDRVADGVAEPGCKASPPTSLTCRELGDRCDVVSIETVTHPQTEDLKHGWGL